MILMEFFIMFNVMLLFIYNYKFIYENIKRELAF